LVWRCGLPWAIRSIKAALLKRFWQNGSKRQNIKRSSFLIRDHKSTVRYPGIEVDDALAVAEQVDV
jgi:hypothetical protein